MDPQDFSLFDNYVGAFHYNSNDCDGIYDISKVGLFGDDRDSLNPGFTEGESSELDPTNEPDGYQGQLSADWVEDEVDLFANHAVNFPLLNDREQAKPSTSSNQFQQMCGERQVTPYTYDIFGQLEGTEGYRKEVIEHYLCNHHSYEGRTDLKNCGLTLWIQRAPLITESSGLTPALCLYKDCHVDPNRHIQAGDLRIAFDEKTALGLEHNPLINAGYVHLKCFEAHTPCHREMFAKLNFKVEGRGPHKKGSWQKNLTVFTTLSQIIYAEDYIENCSKEGRNDGKTSDAILLSAGIEKELRGAHPEVREVERKILEMEGWDDLKALVDVKYAQACSTTLTGNKIDGPQQPGVDSYKSKGANKVRKVYTKRNEEAKKRAGSHNRCESPKIEKNKPRSSKLYKRRYKKLDLSPDQIELEPQPLMKGEGKIKSRLFIRDGKEVWEKYEDLWSPIVSDTENGTEDDEETGKDEEMRHDGDSGDDESSGNDEPFGHTRTRSDDGNDFDDMRY